MSIWKGRNVFVTGASGLLGSNLTKTLIEKGAKVTVLLRDYVPESELIKSGNLKNVNIVSGSLEDYELILRILNEYEIETVFHLGAQTIVPTANNNPLSTFNSNIKGTWNVLEACRIYGKIKAVIVASTDKAYGTQEVLPYTEEMELKGIFPYDVSKVCSDLIAQSYFKTFNLPIAVTRCGNIYGPGDLNFSRIIPAAIKAGLFDETLEIRSDGKFVRDYIFMDDVVSGNIKIAENIDKSRGEALNLSTNNRLSVSEAVDEVSKAMGKKIKLKVLNQAKNEIKDQYLSSEKARKLLGWEAKHSIGDGLKETINWYKIHFRR
ncbi:MAG: GDP-mannose 4,6-dehydratase [archaeon]